MEGSNSSAAKRFFSIGGLDHEKTMNSPSATSSQVPAPAVLTPPKKRRNQPGNPSPDAEVVALSPNMLMASNRFVCEVCSKGFQREQNLQLHRRGHNLPWKLKQNTANEARRKVYICPEPTCVHHDPSRALGDLTGIKKHYSRKHGEKKYKCDKCSKKYAVHSDWKAHSKTCGTKEYRCDCGTLFSRRDSFITHRAFCDALAQEGGIRNPPSLGVIGSSLFGGSHNITLGLSSSQISSETITAVQDHTNLSYTELLRLGDHPQPTTLFKNIDNHIGSSTTGSAFRDTQIMPTSGLFLPEHNHQDFHQPDHQNGLFPKYAYYPDLLQNDENNNRNSPPSTTLFNFRFFASGGTISNSVSNNNSSTSLIVTNQYSNGSEGSSSLFSGSIINGSHDHIGPSTVASLYTAASSLQNPNLNMTSAHLSATALLQKAAQMGSTTSNNSAASNFLRSYGSSSSSGMKWDSGRLAGMAASFGNVFGSDNNENNLNEVMNCLANANAGSANYSMYGGGSQSHRYAENEQEDHNYRRGGYNIMGEQAANTVSFGGSDRMTRDFLGVGEVMRSMGGGGLSQREPASASSFLRSHAFRDGNFQL